MVVEAIVRIIAAVLPLLFFCRRFFVRLFSVLFARAYLENHQAPEDRTTTDMLQFDEYFRVVFLVLMYGGDKVI